MSATPPPKAFSKSFQDLHNAAVEHALTCLVQLLHEKSLIKLPEYVAKLEAVDGFARGAYAQEKNPVLEAIIESFRVQAKACEAKK